MWSVGGYVEEGWELDPNNSSRCYFAVDPTYPIPENSYGEIRLELVRIGAHQPEWSGEGEPPPNQSSYIHTIPMNTMEPAKICKLVWAANSAVNVAGFEDAVSEAAKAARKRKTDVPGGSTSFIDRYNNYDEKKCKFTSCTGASDTCRN